MLSLKRLFSTSATLKQKPCMAFIKIHTVTFLSIDQGNRSNAPLFCFFFPGGCRLPHPPLGRTGRRGTHVLMHFVFFVFLNFAFLLLGVNRPWEVSHFARCEISRGMHLKIMSGDALGASYGLICENMYLCKGLIG